MRFNTLLQICDRFYNGSVLESVEIPSYWYLHFVPNNYSILKVKVINLNTKVKGHTTGTTRSVRGLQCPDTIVWNSVF